MVEKEENWVKDEAILVDFDCVASSLAQYVFLSVALIVV